MSDNKCNHERWKVTHDTPIIEEDRRGDCDFELLQCVSCGLLDIDVVVFGRDSNDITGTLAKWGYKIVKA